MVFTVDATGQIAWLYPAYDGHVDSSSIPIATSAHTSMGELVEHDHAPGPLTIYALFTHRPYRVSEIEHQIHSLQGSTFSGDAVEGGYLQTFHVRVLP
jgi:hypothetical protein